MSPIRSPIKTGVPWPHPQKATAPAESDPGQRESPALPTPARAARSPNFRPVDADSKPAHETRNAYRHRSIRHADLRPALDDEVLAIRDHTFNILRRAQRLLHRQP